MRISESAGHLRIKSDFSVGMRVFLALVGCLPLLAPYELLYKPRWNEYGVFFALMALICCGALSITAFSWFAAIVGRSVTWAFSSDASACVVVRVSPFAKTTTSQFAFSSLGRVELREIDWSEGSPTYYIDVLHVGLEAGGGAGESARVVGFDSIGPFNSKSVAEKTLAAILRVMGRA